MVFTKRHPRRQSLSIVIPAGDSAALEDTLVSVLEHRPPACEVVVALGMPYADPWGISEEVRFVRAPAGASLVGRINIGVAACSGDVVHVLAAGWKATAGWMDRALAHFDRADVGAVVPIGVAENDRDRVVSAGIRRTAGGRCIRLAAAVETPSAPLLEAGFWRADVLARGGFSTACGDALAAADMSATLAAAGMLTVTEPTSRVVQGPGSKEKSAFGAGLAAERLFWRSLTSERLARAAASHLVEVLRHAVALAPLGTLPMIAGRLAALLQFGSCVRRARELRALVAEARTARPSDDTVADRMLRLDAGHSDHAGPHVGVPARQLRRSA